VTQPQEGRPVPTGADRWLPQALRVASHGLVWTMVLVPALIEVADGWQPVRDDAMISIGAYRVFSAQSPLVGAWSQASQGLSHAFFDLGPTMLWLLAVPVRLDPNQGALWGAALVCGGALSTAVEGAWSVKGWPAAVAVALVVGDLGWQTQLFTDLAWNPHIGLVFLLAAGATGWVVASGRFGWWPVVVLFASVAAQCHLVYAITALALAVIAPLAAFGYRHRPPRWRWLVVGLAMGAVCWVTPLIQEASGHPGNLSLVLRSGTSHARVGLAFGIHALSMAVTPRPIWLTRYPYLAAFLGGIPHDVDSHSLVWAVLVACLVAVTVLVAWRGKRLELSALAVVGVVVAVGTAISFASFPAGNLGPLGYLVNVLWLVGALIWIIVLWGGGDLVVEGLRRWQERQALQQHRGHGGRRHLPIRQPVLRVLEVVALLVLVLAGFAGLRTLVPAAREQVAAVKSDAPLDRSMARSVERSVPPGPVIVTVRPESFGPRYGDYVPDLWGVALILLEGGWRPGLPYSFFGSATRLSVPPGARWPEVVVTLDPATKAVTGVRRVEPTAPADGPSRPDRSRRTESAGQSRPDREG
jgi:hypothetical protein